MHWRWGQISYECFYCTSVLVGKSRPLPPEEMWVRIACLNDLSNYNYNHWLYQGIVSCRETFQTEAFVLQCQLWEAPNVPYLSQLTKTSPCVPTIAIKLPFFLQLRLGRLQPVSRQFIPWDISGEQKECKRGIKTIWA